MKISLENQLGILAMKFRGCLHALDCDEQREKIAKEYSEVVDELIKNGNWTEIPGPEDELTHKYMPKAYFKHWGLS